MDNSSTHQTNFILIGDPQLTDKYSYPFMQNKYIASIVQFYSDVFMKRSFRSLINHLSDETDAIIFVGDMFDGGRYLNDEEFKIEWNRFENIFSTNLKRIFVPGNHDVGYGDQNDHVLNRYEQYFGKLNFYESVGPIDILGINSVYLESNKKAKEDVWKLIDEYTKKRTNPVILLSHVPLWRPDNDYCKFERTRGLRQGYGDGYQNLLPYSISQRLLKKVKPFRIFSGDDHQHCEHEHKNYGVIENTIGTFSWLQGEKNPSFGMFSVLTDENVIHSEFTICFLPPQEYLYKWYMILFMITILPLLLIPMISTIRNGIMFWRNNKQEPKDLESGLTKIDLQEENTTKKVLKFLGKILWRGSLPTLATATIGIFCYLLILGLFH